MLDVCVQEGSAEETRASGSSSLLACPDLARARGRRSRHPAVFPVLSVDPIESAILASGIGRSFETGLAAYLVAKALAAEQLRAGLSVVIDAVSPVEEARAMWRQLATEHDAALIVIECVLDPELHRERVESRVRGLRGIPEVTWRDVQERRKEYVAWEQERLVLDTSRPVEELVTETLAALRAYRRRSRRS